MKQVLICFVLKKTGEKWTLLYLWRFLFAWSVHCHQVQDANLLTVGKKIIFIFYYLLLLFCSCVIKVRHKFISFYNVINSSINDIQKLNRRYAESTIASDISKIMDSMVQKNFVNFLLNQREKKSE